MIAPLLQQRSQIRRLPTDFRNSRRLEQYSPAHGAESEQVSRTLPGRIGQRATSRQCRPPNAVSLTIPAARSA